MPVASWHGICSEDHTGGARKGGQFRVVRSYLRHPPKPGGMEKHIEAISAAQRALGVDVVNVFNEGASPGDSVQVLPSIPLGSVVGADYLRKVIYYAAMMASRRRIVSSIPTVLHVHGDWKDFFLATIVANSIGVNAMVATIHDAIPASRLSLTARSLAAFSLVFCTGKREQIALERALDRKVYHMPSAPSAIFGGHSTLSDGKGCDVVSVCSLVKKKQVDLVVRCAAARPSWRFAVYGDGDQLKELEILASSLGADNIVFHGRATAEEIRRALSGSRVFLSTATREGTPTAAMEAMAAGVPVVLTPSNDYEWLVGDRESGYVAEDWSVASILRHLDSLLEDEGLRARMGVAARLRMSRENWQSKAIELSNLMRSVLEAQGLCRRK